MKRYIAAVFVTLATLGMLGATSTPASAQLICARANIFGTQVLDLCL